MCNCFTSKVIASIIKEIFLGHTYIPFKKKIVAGAEAK